MADNALLEKAKDFKFRGMAAQIANGEPFPGALKDAFVAGPIKIGNLTVREVVPSDFVLMARLDSPIRKYLMEIQQNPESEPKVDITEEQQCEIAFQFTRPVTDARKVLASGRDKFTEQAVALFDEPGSPDPMLVVMAAMEQVRRSFSTRLSQYEEVKDSGELNHFFGNGAAMPRKTD